MQVRNDSANDSLVLIHRRFEDFVQHKAMQHTSFHPAEKQGRGGRISSPRLRETIEQSQDFEGLEENVRPYDLLKLVKRAGKAAGFTSKMIQLLDHYMMFTREIDWQQGSQPIVYQSLYKTAMDLGVSERQIQILEKRLFEVGALTWNDSGNCKRFGQRCAKSGRIIYAYGVDLTPLAYLKDKLENIIQEQELYKAAWMETKRQVSWYRGQIKAILAEMQEQGLIEEGAFAATYDTIAVPYRTSMSLEMLRTMLAEHKKLHEQVLEVVAVIQKEEKQEKDSPTDDSFVVHKQITNLSLKFNKLNTSRDSSHCFQGRRNAISEEETEQTGLTENPESAESRAGALQETPPEPSKAQESEDTDNILLKSGLQHITVKQLLNAASPRFKDRIPLEPRAMNFDDVVTAAYALRPELHISQKSWVNACQTLTRYGAAICLLLTDQAAQREENPVRKPAAYFNAMIARARAGELHLHKSVFGILKREYGDPANNNTDEKSPAERS